MSTRRTRRQARRADANGLWTDAALAALSRSDAVTDAWLADHDAAPPVDHQGRPALRRIGGTFRQARPEVVVPFVPAPLADDDPYDGPTIVVGGYGPGRWTAETAAAVPAKRYRAEDVDALMSAPSFEWVTQSATTHHRDRRAFTARPTTRVVVRDRQDGSRRTFVRRLVPSATAVVTGEQRDAQGRLVGRERSPRQGRAMVWRTMGHWDGHTWLAAAPARPVGRPATGDSRQALIRRLSRSAEGQAFVLALLRSAETAAAAPDQTARTPLRGLTAVLDADGLAFQHRDGRTWRGSWRGRKALARKVAVATLA